MILVGGVNETMCLFDDVVLGQRCRSVARGERKLRFYGAAVFANLAGRFGGPGL